MSLPPDPPIDPPGPPARAGAGEAPVISLAEVRRRRQAPPPDTTGEAEILERREREARQLAALHGLLLQERMSAGDLIDMIKLGMVTESEELLPCNSRTRMESYRDWEAKYYAGPAERDPPDETLIHALGARLCEGYDAPAMARLQTESRKRLPDANQVTCPLLSPDRETLPPCIEALRCRGQTRIDRAGETWHFMAAPLDEQDPVVRTDLRPCVVLGRELYLAIMLPVWLRRQEDE